MNTLEEEEIQVVDVSEIEWRNLDADSLESALPDLQKTLERLIRAQNIRPETLMSEISI